MAYINVSKEPKFTLQNGYFASTLIGLGSTVKTLAKQIFGLEPSRTIQWPEVEYQYSPRFKGAHFLTKRPDGKVRCTACFLCATNCPAQCITIIATETKDKTIEKYPARFEIDILRCVFCGYCEEACPVDAIRMGPEYSMAGLIEEKKWVFTKDYLLERETIIQKVAEKQVSDKEENEKHPSAYEKVL